MYYTQTKEVNWLNTPKDCVWIETFSTYIQPLDHSLRDTKLGVDLSLIDDMSLFKPTKVIDILDV